MSRPEGVICPILTPFGPDGRIARDLFAAHARDILARGAHFLSPFGTTGEALSVSLRERMQALDWLIEDGVPADRLMPGTGLPATGETAELTAHAVRAGCAAAMILPSFYFKAAPEEGQARHFREVIARVDDARLRVILYNIPQTSGVAVSPALAARLAAEFPGTVVAYKDSSGDWENSAAVIAAAPALSVLPGSEALMPRGLANGARGTISASINAIPEIIREVHDGLRAGRDVAAAEARMMAFRKAMQGPAMIANLKGFLAVRSGDRRWLNLRAPHLDATEAQGRALAAVLDAAPAAA